ncbi:MAG: Smr/MutS family protein [Flavobacterium sp.]|nr:Smr/MutS family protein [Pedobacter sp.]
MKYKLGDFVRFVDERIEGYITRIIDEQTVAVTDQDDFEITVGISQITWVHGKQPSERVTVEDNVVLKDENFQQEGIFLAFLTDERASAVVHFQLLNQTDFQLVCTLKTENEYKYKGEFLGEVKPQSSVNVYSASLSELDRWPEFNFQLLRYSSGNTKPLAPIAVIKKLRAKDFAGAKKLVPFSKSTGWLIQLDEPELVIDAQQLKESFHKPIEEKTKIENPGKEIDLHIEKLRDDYQFLNHSEMLDIQLSFFRRSLDAAIVHKLNSIIFIHGLGNGTLKNEIHKIISKHKQVKTFMDARKEKFGYGATEVFFK